MWLRKGVDGEILREYMAVISPGRLNFPPEHEIIVTLGQLDQPLESTVLRLVRGKPPT